MEIWSIDFDKTLQEISEWIDSWKVERYGADSLNPERYYKLTPDGRYIYGKGGEGVAEGESLNKEKADSEKLLDILCRLRLINQKLKGKGLSQHLQWQKREELEKERETLYREYLELVKHNSNCNPEPQQIPTELSTPEAKVYLDKAIELGLMDSNYKWLKGLQMLACFAREMSMKLQLGKGVNGDGQPRISWLPFETLFNLERYKLRSNYNDIQKTGQSPIEIGLIDKVFE